MFRQAKDAGAVGLGVAANALEDRRAVVDDVGHDVNLCLFPGDEFSVVPDILGGLQGHSRTPKAGGWVNYSGVAAMGEWGVIFDPHSVSLAGLKSSAYVRFSVLALSSIFFLVDPFAALPTFLAVTAGADAQRRRKMAWKASVTALVVLCAFAVAGQYIFKMFGITLPAFEIAGGVILLLIGLDMLEAKRSPTQESSEEAAAGGA